ncbi:23S rRNA (adenine(2503)-C(2))-methyltransferase RlmN [Caldanaerobius polysaccharolyticus]|uniref:23S rRNA (adenine(2503)-C(2))-methyltransferase RlmN n=1 Tax=Caldanaerobius polysaccharolyticus TaxID=44256 RepID=UPI00047AE943|nr:23S rRNA (adenine(2503)-C(2))-methyltransferase RlmN [Caldanaerobius polysaccharolyticus]
MIDLYDLSIQELEDLFKKIGEPSYRAKQMFDWLYKGIQDISEVTVFSNELKDKLREIAYIGRLSVVKKQLSKDKETIKYLFKLKDKNVIESVVIKYRFGYTQCISTQVGCRMGCAFCASTVDGIERNLTSGEMVEQILAAQRDTGRKMSRVVLMGSGEPMDNYAEVLKFIRCINIERGLNIGQRHITVSTCGIVPGILKLAEEGLQVNLAVSLHAPNDEIRSQLMPINKKYGIKDVLQACKYYVLRTNRRVTFEYALIRGLNDSIHHAVELAKLLKEILCHVNLIPVNNVKDQFLRPSEERVNEFARALQIRGISTTVRRELGSDIKAACGQLRRSYVSGK